MKRIVGIIAILSSPLVFISVELAIGFIQFELWCLLSIIYIPSLIIIAIIMKKLRLFIFLCFLSTLAPTYGIQPKIGLALGGGGAKGAATIGALRVIEQSNIKIDYIAGTSIGAVIGGLYASGFTLDEIERFLFSLNEIDALDINYIESEMRRLLRNRGCEYIQNTRIPFRCVATDADNLKEHVLSEGKLYKAILASMSIPVLYPFVQWGRFALYDGGLVNNLPVDVVKSMGADIVIAIDLQQNEDDGLQIPSIGLGGIFDTLADWSSSRPDKKKYRLNVKAADIYIHPNLIGYDATSFGRHNCEIMRKKGETEAQKHLNEIKKL